MKTGFSLTGLVLLGVMPVAAQFPESATTDLRRDRGQRAVMVRGQVSCEGTPGSLTVELLASGHGPSASTEVQADGSFVFPSVVPGGYELRMTGSGGTIIHQQSVLISGPDQNLSINLPERENADRNGRTSISIRQLQHKIPPEARKEFSKGVAASKKGEHSIAIDHFQKAVSIDPELADAYNNLGSAHAALGQFEQAAEQFQKAIDLVPDHSLAVANLSVALCKLNRYHEAEQAARRALQLDSSLLKVRYILAVSLIAQHADSIEALENLQRAAADVPEAHLVAANILAQTGRSSDAAKQLEDYLRATPEQDKERQKVEAWLAQLRHQ